MRLSLITKKSNKPKVTQEDLGKMLVNIFESGYINKNQAYKMSFIKGLLSGLGGVVGATLLVALLLWALTLFSHVPLLKSVVNNVKDTLKSQTK